MSTPTEPESDQPQPTAGHEGGLHADPPDDPPDSPRDDVPFQDPGPDADPAELGPGA